MMPPNSPTSDAVNPRCPLEGSFFEVTDWNRRAAPIASAPMSEAKMQRALQRLHSAIDGVMGDSDLDDDESELMLAMQEAAQFVGDAAASLYGSPASAPVPESPSTEAPKEVSHTDDVCVQHSGSLPLRASSGSASTGAAHLTNAEVGRAPVPERKPVAFRERRQIGDDSEGEAQYRKNVKQWERTVEDVLDNVLGYHERTVLSYAEGGGKAATVTVREVRELAYAVRMLIQGREIDREINRRAHPSDSRETLERAAQVCEALGEERRAEAVEFSNRDNHELYALLVKEARTADECARRIRALPAVPSDDTERLASAVDDSDDPTEDDPNGQCTHGVGLDEDCEACEAEDREERERSTAHADRCDG